MGKDILKQIKKLADKGKFDELITLVEGIPEGERTMDIIGAYVRALNNTDQLEKAVEISLQYQEQGANDMLWNYRLGYALFYLRRYGEARAILRRARELAKGDTSFIIDIEQLLEIMEDVSEERETLTGDALIEKIRSTMSNASLSKEEATEKRKAVFVPHDPQKPYFDGVDFAHFCCELEYALGSYVGAPATDEMFTNAEKELGYKLPEAYKTLMRQYNGGVVPHKYCFTLPFASNKEPSNVHVSGFFGVDPSKPRSLLGSQGSKFMIEEWGYPDIGIAICDCPSGGHDMIFLDYRECGKNGEPSVVHIDQEGDYSITYLAGDFESFVLGLHNIDDENTAMITYENHISVCFYIENSKPFEIGKKMNKINEQAYMNGYNWEAFFNFYLPKYAPEVMAGMDSDPEAGTYVAYYDLTPENEASAKKFVAIIENLVDNEEEIYRVLREDGDKIQWD